MTDIELEKYSQLVRFFEKQAEWLGLQRTAGPVLTALTIAKYHEKKPLNADQLAAITGYSRSNMGLILSQLEALGLVHGFHDPNQSGRGRKKILYHIGEGPNSLMQMGVKKTIDRLLESGEEITYLKELYGSGSPQILIMLDAMEDEIEDALDQIGAKRTKQIAKS
jgi:DNA-binding transcriptional regulator GbsR (MarR family)